MQITNLVAVRTPGAGMQWQKAPFFSSFHLVQGFVSDLDLYCNAVQQN